MLLRATIERLRDFDMDVIRLLVKQNNKIARRLYENFGFHDTGQRVDHFGPGEDRLVMSLLLSGQGASGTARGQRRHVRCRRSPWTTTSEADPCDSRDRLRACQNRYS